MAVIETKPRDVQVEEIADKTTILRSRTWERLKFEVEYSLQRGTTSNSYWIQSEKTVLFDPPGESFTDIYLQELQQYLNWQKLDYIILSHVNPNRIATLKALLEWAPHVKMVCSRPGAITLAAALPDKQEQIIGVRGEETLDLGKGHCLQFIPTPTPRWPDSLCTFDPASEILFTDKFFGVHVCGDEVSDRHWKELDVDRHFYFDCLHAAQARRVEAALEKLAHFNPKMYAPAHGPLVRYSLSRLRYDYKQWCNQQRSSDLRVVLLYASAYGNTTVMAQAIAKGLVEAGIAVDVINCEWANPAEIAQEVETCDGFIIGTPTLAGHAPTQIQTALGIILSNASKNKLAGVFGSYGWSGEAVDSIANKLLDAGYQLGFDSLRVKFSPTETDLSQCSQAAGQFALKLRSIQKTRITRQPASEAQAGRTEQAIGRIVSPMSVLTTWVDGQPVGLLATWISQASFNPPGLTLALSNDPALERFTQVGSRFVLNILKEGASIRRQIRQQGLLGASFFEQVLALPDSDIGLVLTDAVSYLECTVQNRIPSGDHWLVYVTLASGKVLDATGVTVVQHRKSGSHY
jgi:flavorubredoxin/flavin reductase (DIM6/NTAB) family NADH-FMN oxidoreductase RutF